MQNLDSSFLSIDERGNIIPNTAEATLVVAQAYLQTTQPAPGDPRESMYQAAMKGLELIGDKLNKEEISRKVRWPHQKIVPSRLGKAEDLDHNTMQHHNHVGPGRPDRQITSHEKEMQETSSHRPG
jgi:hypothetical protein